MRSPFSKIFRIYFARSCFEVLAPDCKVDWKDFSQKNRRNTSYFEDFFEKNLFKVLCKQDAKTSKHDHTKYNLIVNKNKILYERLKKCITSEVQFSAQPKLIFQIQDSSADEVSKLYQALSGAFNKMAREEDISLNEFLEQNLKIEKTDDKVTITAKDETVLSKLFAELKTSNLVIPSVEAKPQENKTYTAPTPFSKKFTPRQ